MRIRARWIVLGAAGAAAALAVGIYAATHTNSAPITINDVAAATPYPSTIVVSGDAVTVTDVNVRLTNVTHPFTDDVDVLLESPSGARTILVSDAGDGVGVSGVNLAFDDAAPLPIADESAPVAGGGPYKPTNYGQSAAPACASEPHPDVFPSPAPAGPYSASLATFNGGAANGTWSLFVVDDCGGDAGLIAQGWSITFSGPTAVSVRDFTGRAIPGRVELRWRTGSEVDVLGFDVYRSSRARKLRVNRKLIAAKGSARAVAYRLVDRRVRPGISYTYRLQVVNRDGSRVSAGLVALRAR